MAKHLIQDHTGHSVIEFNKDNVVELAEAEKRFKELTGKGFIAASMTPGKGGELIRKFDPTVEETMFHPHLKGG